MLMTIPQQVFSSYEQEKPGMSLGATTDAEAAVQNDIAEPRGAEGSSPKSVENNASINSLRWNPARLGVLYVLKLWQNHPDRIPSLMANIAKACHHTYEAALAVLEIRPI
jgi:hypothetical protein